MRLMSYQSDWANGYGRPPRIRPSKVIAPAFEVQAFNLHNNGQPCAPCYGSSLPPMVVVVLTLPFGSATLTVWLVGRPL
jgi:hypothetical protein